MYISEIYFTRFNESPTPDINMHMHNGKCQALYLAIQLPSFSLISLLFHHWKENVLEHVPVSPLLEDTDVKVTNTAKEVADQNCQR